MKKVLFIVAVAIFSVSLLVLGNTPAPAEETYLEEMRNITIPQEFKPYKLKSIPADTNPDLGQIIDTDVRQLIAYGKWEKVRVRALKPRDGVECTEYGMDNHLAIIDGTPTPLCVIIE